MITKEQATELTVGDTLYHAINKNADGSPQRWKVNGKVKLWKTRPNSFRVPVKHGMYLYDYVTYDTRHLVSLTDTEV